MNLLKDDLWTLVAFLCLIPNGSNAPSDSSGVVVHEFLCENLFVRHAIAVDDSQGLEVVEVQDSLGDDYFIVLNEVGERNDHMLYLARIERADISSEF